ncbi:transposase family protein [Nocardia asteroides]|uniref:transposase family protein n=1 Tax=Nocardia asteroides TaxID=1824 RepID=UPI00342F9312
MYRASAQAATAPCVCCGHAATRVHSRYERHLVDVPLGGRRLVLRLRVRRCHAARWPVAHLPDLPTRPRYPPASPAAVVFGARAAPSVSRSAPQKSLPRTGWFIAEPPRRAGLLCCGCLLPCPIPQRKPLGCWE